MSSQDHAQPHAGASTHAHARPTWGAVCWLGILTAIGIVQIVRAQWFDAAVFFGTAVLLVADAYGWLPPAPRRRRRTARTLLIGAAVAAVVLSALPRHQPAMMIAAGAVGVGAVVLAWPQRAIVRTPWPRAVRRLAWMWAVILVAGCLWELAEFILGRVDPQLVSFALSDLLNPLVDTMPGHILFVCAWAAMGFFLVRRGGGR